MQRVAEDCLPLNANRLAKGGWFRGEGLRTGVITWTNGSSISLNYQQPHLHLSCTRNGEPMRQTVHVETAPCHFGGARHYFTCPGCDQRRYKLRLGGDGFYCRQCYRLPYYSQECGDLDGLIHQKHKVEAKLEDGERPPMRTYTRMRLINQLCALDDRIDSAMIERFDLQTMQSLGIGLS